MSVEHSIEIRVRYHETDGQRRVHHAQYLNYFERGRVELMRSLGHSYRELEEKQNLMLVVAEMNIRYLAAAMFDDRLQLTTRVTRSRGVRIYHDYRIVNVQHTPALPVVQASSVIACINSAGKVTPLPDFLRM